MERQTMTTQQISWLRRSLLMGATVAMVLGGVLATASAEGGAVRYSYEEVRVGGDRQYVLVPRGEADLRGEVTAAKLEQVFEALRQAKRSTYGNSYASASGTSPDNFTVEVTIDANKRDFATVIMAEAVYTLTEFGIDEVHFPGHSDQGLNRADIAFSAYTLSVPLFQVLPETSLTTAQVLMPDGDLVPVAEVGQMWRQDRQAMVDAVYTYLESSDPWTVRTVVRRLDEFGDLRVDAVLPLLTHQTRDVRVQALSALAGREDEEAVLAAVSSALQQEESNSMGRRMAEFLGASSDPQYNVEEQFFLVERGDDDEALQAAEALVQWDDDERVVNLLAELLRDERQELPATAAQSLDELDAHQVRLAALEDEDVSADIRRRLSEDLADEANPDAVRLAALTYIANDRSGGYAGQAIASMAQLPQDEAREQVEQFLSDSSMDRRRAAIEALANRNEVASVAALMAAAEEQEESDLMEETAYAIMVDQPMEVIIEQTRASSVNVQRLAFQAVGERAVEEGASGEVMETIEAGVDHRLAEIRGASARALGEIGGDDSLETLSTMTDDSSAVVRRDVALALGNFEDDDHARVLVDYLDDSDSGVVAAAILSLEQRNDPRAADRIDDLDEHEDPRVRAAVLRAVTTYLPDDESAVRRHMGMLSGAVNDDSRLVQLEALEQLGRFDLGMAVTNIAILVSDEDPVIRAAAVDALSKTGNEDARSLVRRALDDQASLVRRRAINALSELAGSDARQALEERMESEEDPEIRDLLEAQLQQI